MIQQQLRKGSRIPSKGVQCGFCFRKVYQHQEADGFTKTVEGKVMCPTCRAFKLSSLAVTIVGDRKKHDKDRKKAYKLAEQHEQERVAQIAANSVEESFTQNTRVRNKKGIN